MLLQEECLLNFFQNLPVGCKSTISVKFAIRPITPPPTLPCSILDGASRACLHTFYYKSQQHYLVRAGNGFGYSYCHWLWPLRVAQMLYFRPGVPGRPNLLASMPIQASPSSNHTNVPLCIYGKRNKFSSSSSY